MKQQNNRRIIAVDFDDTLTLGGNKWWENEESIPNFKMIELVVQQYIKGNTIIIHTGRPWNAAALTVAWLIKYGVRFHGIMCGKLLADVYLDDKALNVEDVMNGTKSI